MSVLERVLNLEGRINKLEQNLDIEGIAEQVTTTLITELRKRSLV